MPPAMAHSWGSGRGRQWPVDVTATALEARRCDIDRGLTHRSAGGAARTRSAGGLADWLGEAGAGAEAGYYLRGCLDL